MKAKGQPDPSEPEAWEQRLRLEKEPSAKRLELLLKLADASAQVRSPSKVRSALGEAVRTARTLDEAASKQRQDKSNQPELITSNQKFVDEFREFLACRILSQQPVESIRAQYPELAHTRVYTEHLYTQVGKQLQALHNGGTPADGRTLIEKLREARESASGDQQLQARIDGDLAEIQAYLTAVETFPPPIAQAWAHAAAKTNQARTPADWDAAAASWRVVLSMLVGRPAMERREAAVHVVHSLLRMADLLHAERKNEAARRVLRQARAELGTMPEAVGRHLTQEDKERIGKRISHNGKALNTGTVLAGTRGEKSIPAFRGTSLKPVATECVIIRYKSPHTPNVDQWLKDLGAHPNAVRRLVDWFNNGPIARKTPDAKRDFSANPASPNYLVTFLEKYIYRKPGALLPGTMQWCDPDGKGQWRGTAVKKAGEAAYYLKDGTAIVRAVGSNPIGVIRIRMNSSAWLSQTEAATPRAAPQIPSLDAIPPRKELIFGYNPPIVEAKQ